MATATAGAVTGPRRRSASLLTALTWVIGMVFFLPVLWMVITAFKREADAYTDPPSLIFTPTLEQFRALFDAGAWPYFLNSLFATAVSTLLVLCLAVPAAYALSIRPVKKTQDVLFFFISTKMLPVVAVIVPIYVIAGRVGALDNVWTLIVLYTAMNLPIAVWMMRSFLQEIPAEVLEAASMDGATLRQTMLRVLLPMVAPGLAATALIWVVSQRRFAWWR
nr:carbohydrate ABC transporter permease [Jiangella gansuensis]